MIEISLMETERGKRDPERYEAVAQRLERAADALRKRGPSVDLELLMEAVDPGLWSTNHDRAEAARKLFAELICSRCGESMHISTINKDGICLFCVMKEEGLVFGTIGATEVYWACPLNERRDERLPTPLDTCR